MLVLGEASVRAGTGLAELEGGPGGMGARSRVRVSGWMSAVGSTASRAARAGDAGRTVAQATQHRSRREAARRSGAGQYLTLQGNNPPSPLAGRANKRLNGGAARAEAARGSVSLNDGASRRLSAARRGRAMASSTGAGPRVRCGGRRRGGQRAGPGRRGSNEAARPRRARSSWRGRAADAACRWARRRRAGRARQGGEARAGLGWHPQVTRQAGRARLRCLRRRRAADAHGSAS